MISLGSQLMFFFIFFRSFHISQSVSRTHGLCSPPTLASSGGGVGILYGPVVSRGVRGSFGVLTSFNFGDAGLFCGLLDVAPLGDPGSVSQSDCSVLAMGESELIGRRTSPGTVIGRLRVLGTGFATIPGARGGFNVNLCADVPSSNFLPPRDRLFSGDARAGVDSRDGGFGRA